MWRLQHSVGNLPPHALRRNPMRPLFYPSHLLGKEFAIRPTGWKWLVGCGSINGLGGYHCASGHVHARQKGAQSLFDPLLPLDARRLASEKCWLRRPCIRWRNTPRKCAPPRRVNSLDALPVQQADWVPPLFHQRHWPLHAAPRAARSIIHHFRHAENIDLSAPAYGTWGMRAVRAK